MTLQSEILMSLYFFVDSYCNMCGIYLGAGPWLEMTVEYAKEKEKQLDLFKFLKDPLPNI